jgi:hypothetical protein
MQRLLADAHKALRRAELNLFARLRGNIPCPHCGEVRMSIRPADHGKFISNYITCAWWSYSRDDPHAVFISDCEYAVTRTPRKE